MALGVRQPRHRGLSATVDGPITSVATERDHCAAADILREQANRVADRIDAGMVFVNGVDAEGVELPFGGVKRSGFGRELGRFGIDEFVNKKLVRIVG